MASFEAMLTGGHPNSLGRTEEVVEAVLADPTRLPKLYACYASPDAVVRLRTSSAFKRISRADPGLLVPYIERFLTEVAALDQASAQWTLAELYNTLKGDMTAEQVAQAQAIMRRNLRHSTDWIVLIQTMQTLVEWSAEDADLRARLRPELERLSGDKRKSVANRAAKLLAALERSNHG